MSKAFGFREQLAVGDKGEAWFLANYPRRLEKLDGRKADFRVASSLERLELKTDSYSLEKTPNFFFERFSDRDKKTPGGPWRAKQDKVDIFCYLFIASGTWFEFRDIPALVKHLDAWLKAEKPKPKTIPNRGWVTEGYAVPRNSVSGLYIRQTEKKDA